jgi:hypothetical protein
MYKLLYKLNNRRTINEILGSHSGEGDNVVLLGYDTM